MHIFGVAAGSEAPLPYLPEKSILAKLTAVLNPESSERK